MPEEEIGIPKKGAVERNAPVYDEYDEPELAKNYLLTIGIDKYNDKGGNRSTRFFDLDSCRQDCKNIAEVLATKYGFEHLPGLYDEKATLPNIRKFFREFKESNEGRVQNANLIIYYSGHGKMFDAGGGVKIGCWVPTCADDTEYKNIYEFYTMEDLEKELLPLVNMRHILIVSDACQSGGIFESSGYFKFSAEAGKTQEMLPDERSCWAIASSRSNEPAVAGHAGESSRFTKILVDVLKDNGRWPLLLSSVISDIQEAFVNEVDHKPISGPLNVRKNSGQFIFYADRKILGIESRKKHLTNALQVLNYNNQIDCFLDFTNPKTPVIASLSGTEDGGLGFVFKIAKRLPPYNAAAFMCNANMLSIYRNKTTEQKLKGDEKPTEVPGTLPPKIDEIDALSFFNSILKSSSANMAELTDFLHRQYLDSGHVIIELFFHPATVEAKTKEKLLLAAAEIGQSVILKNKALGQLFIFVVDFEAYDYREIFATKVFSGIQVVNLGQVEEMDARKLRKWYDLYKLTLPPAVSAEFDKLFKQQIYDGADEIIRPGLALPGTVIRTICKKSLCDDLAKSLLD
jgi:hypothetical protein